MIYKKQFNEVQRTVRGPQWTLLYLHPCVISSPGIRLALWFSVEKWNGMQLIRHEILGTRSFDAWQLKLDLLEYTLWGKLLPCKKSDYPETTMFWRNPTYRSHLKSKINDYAPVHSSWGARPRCQSRKALSWTDSPGQISYDSDSVMDTGRLSCIRGSVILKQYYIWT